MFLSHSSEFLVLSTNHKWNWLGMGTQWERQYGEIHWNQLAEHWCMNEIVTCCLSRKLSNSKIQCGTWRTHGHGIDHEGQDTEKQDWGSGCEGEHLTSKQARSFSALRENKTNKIPGRASLASVSSPVERRSFSSLSTVLGHFAHNSLH